MYLYKYSMYITYDIYYVNVLKSSIHGFRKKLRPGESLLVADWLGTSAWPGEGQGAPDGSTVAGTKTWGFSTGKAVGSCGNPQEYGEIPPPKGETK